MSANNDTKTIIPIEQAIIMPAVSAADAVEAWQKYLDLKKAIVDRDTDVQVIENKEFLKKSYWRKLATFFNISTEVVSERSENIGRTVVWHFVVKATHPSGRSAIGAGSCDAFEKAKRDENGNYVVWDYYNKRNKPATPNSLHNIRSTAETRATNRAISNLVGGGEVSAEEVSAADIEKEDPKYDDQ